MTEEIIIKYISEFGIGLSFGMLIIIGSLWIFINLMAYLERKEECKKFNKLYLGVEVKYEK